ncbi:MAG: hypothetical protein PHP82_04130 [Candidatus ainarchaeum sp.]|nr:hypothetical protein [Candidatus ainarchaeum sp.]
MGNVNFIKEVIPNIENNNLLVIVNQNQIKESINFFLKNIINEQKIILVSFSEPAKNIFEKFDNKNFFIIDAFSNEKKEGQNFFGIKNQNDLVQIQIAIKKALQKIGKNTIIVFDSLSIISIYNSPKETGKFIYLFNNKMKLEKNSCIFFITENSVDEEIISFAKQFCDKTFDFSKIYSHTIQNK